MHWLNINQCVTALVRHICSGVFQCNSSESDPAFFFFFFEKPGLICHETVPLWNKQLIVVLMVKTHTCSRVSVVDVCCLRHPVLTLCALCVSLLSMKVWLKVFAPRTRPGSRDELCSALSADRAAKDVRRCGVRNLDISGCFKGFYFFFLFFLDWSPTERRTQSRGSERLDIKILYKVDSRQQKSHNI